MKEAREYEHEYYLRQCKLERKVPNGIATLVSYIPEKFAKVGRILKLKNEEGEWNDGYEVKFVSSERMSSANIIITERAHLRQRGASDI